VPSILALGDVTGGPELTPVALAEAMHLVKQHFGDTPVAPLDYQNIATAVFCHPNIGTVVSRRSRRGSSMERFASIVPISDP
jgi:glutathione reductase (NADPH)